MPKLETAQPALPYPVVHEVLFAHFCIYQLPIVLCGPFNILGQPWLWFSQTKQNVLLCTDV